MEVKATKNEWNYLRRENKNLDQKYSYHMRPKLAMAYKGTWEKNSFYLRVNLALDKGMLLRDEHK